MRLPIACPAATEINLPDVGPSVRCGVLARSNDGAEVNGWEARGQVDDTFEGHTVTARRFCCDDGTTDERTGYTRCVIWEAERKAQAAGRSGPDALHDEEATRVDAGPDPRVAGALDALQSGSFSEAGAVERALQAGGVVLGG